jgi:predicted phosphate transport protein (TIGR00153 family)
MAAITDLFGESPFHALKEHAQKVYESVGLLRELFEQLTAGHPEQVRVVAERIFAMESEADKVRNQLHERLTSRAMMSLRREDFFNILEQQDSIADRAEAIAATLTYRDMRLPADMMAEINDYLEGILKNCELAAGIMSKMDLLVEASFGGRDALTVSKLITELAEREDATKGIQIQLTRRFLAAAERLPAVETMLWLDVIGYIADLSAFADRTGNGVRMTLHIKKPKE